MASADFPVQPISEKQEPETAKVRTGTDEQVTYVKAVRAWAMITIVTLHVSFPLIYLYNSLPNLHWWIGNNFYILGKTGSPLFTMVSGFLLLNPTKDQPIPVFFRKRFVKVLIPFLAWAVVYLAWRVFFHGETLTPYGILTAVFQGPVYYHLWFIQMILGLYLATPILRVYTRYATRENLTYFLGIWFVAVAVLPLIQRFTGIEVNIDIVVTTDFVGFFILGHYLRDVVISRKQVLPILLIIGGMYLFTQYATHALTVAQGGTFDNALLQNQGFNIIIITVCAYLFLKSLDYQLIYARLPLVGWAITLISSCSLGIYFIHVLVIELLQSGRLGFRLDGTTIHPFIGIPLTTLVALIASIAIVRLLKKAPLIRHFVP